MVGLLVLQNESQNPVKDKLLIIDDEEFVHRVLHQRLDDYYDAKSTMTGSQGYEEALAWNPDVILLDVDMPGQNGYEVCDVLKRDENTADIPIIFHSQKSSLRERMLGYEVGADDYLLKSSGQEEVLTKLRKVLDYAKVKKNLKHSADSAQQTALEAMSTSFELGKAVRFVERTYNASSTERLGEYLMEFANDLDLSAVCMIISSKGNYYFSSTQAQVAPLEQELMQMLHGEKRFTDFGCRTQINYSRIALLIKNMPLEDRARYGRLKDTLPFVLGAADAKSRY